MQFSSTSAGTHAPVVAQVSITAQPSHLLEMLKLGRSRQRQKPLPGICGLPGTCSPWGGQHGWLWASRVAKLGEPPLHRLWAWLVHRGANKDLGRVSQPCLPLSLSLQRESANILISSHTQTLRPDPRIHILGDLHKLPAINRAHEVQGLKASTLAKKMVQEDWKGGRGRGLQAQPWRAEVCDGSGWVQFQGCHVTLWGHCTLLCGGKGLLFLFLLLLVSMACAMAPSLHISSMKEGQAPSLTSAAHPPWVPGGPTGPKPMFWLWYCVYN